MVVDIDIGEDLSTSYDAVGDVQTVSDDAGIRQAISIDLIEQIGEGAPPLTPRGIEDQRSQIEQVVRANTFTDAPISVTVEEIDEGEQRITYIVQTNSVSLRVSREG